MPGPQAPVEAPQAPASGTQVLELDATGPRELAPAALHEPVASPAGEPSTPRESAALTPDVPVPVPGTVARNAPKRS
ncbi:hypothetical protein HPC49_53515 [Pyxidicoccus fallax]|nr:hypothetical protein [Pyxidicoccus fallax]